MNKTGADVVKTDAVDFLRQLAEGRVVYEIAAEMETVVKAVVATLKPGKVTITLDIGPLKGSVSQLLIEAGVSGRVPKESTSSVFFPLGDGTLSRKNPNQMDFSEKEPTFDTK